MGIVVAKIFEKRSGIVGGLNSTPMELLPIVVSGDANIFDWCFFFWFDDRDG